LLAGVAAGSRANRFLGRERGQFDQHLIAEVHVAHLVAQRPQLLQDQHFLGFGVFGVVALGERGFYHCAQRDAPLGGLALGELHQPGFDLRVQDGLTNRFLHGSM
jgi:hypothetical protein